MSEIQPIHRKQMCRGRGAIAILGGDANEARCITEDQLNRWFVGLAPELKAEIYEISQAEPESECRFCGCTDSRACFGGCSWLDNAHTVCSAEPCHRKYLREIALGQTESTPQADSREIAIHDFPPELRDCLTGAKTLQQVEDMLRTLAWVDLPAATKEVPDAAV